MRGAAIAVLCAIALTHGATVLNKNGCPTDPLIHKSLPHSECDRYYRCLLGNLFEMPCPVGLHFSVATNQCEIPAVANCQHKVETPIDQNVITGSEKTSQAYAACAAAGSEGALVAHENCNYFYKCNFGLPVAMACPGTTLFDPSTEICDWPQNVECGGRPIAENDNDNNDEWDPNTGGNNNDPSQAPAICAREESDHVMIAHENCNQFYQCWAGKPVALSCPGKLLFNPKNDWCDFASNVECGLRLIPENWGTDDQNVNNPIEEDEVPVGNNHYDPSQASSICAASSSEGVLVAHENCNQFYTCNFGRPIAQICPGTLLFDPTKDRCEWRDTVQCGNRVIPNPEDIGNGGNEWNPNTGGNNNDPSQAPAICAREGSDHVMIAHENCNQFYQCWAGRPVALSCPGKLLFNPKNDWCDFASNVECGSRLIPENWGTDDQNVNNPIEKEEEPVGNNHYDPSQAPAICAAAESEGVLVAHENCNQFYTCNFGRPIAQICPGTLLFDPTKDRCEWRDTVQCGNRVIPNPEDIGNGGNEWNPNTGGNNNDPSQAPAICAREGSDHVMIAHENCNQFYQCWAGRPVALSCPGKLLFNPKNDWCDFASNVECGSRLIPENWGTDDQNVNNPIEKEEEPVGNNHYDPSQAPAICAAAESEGVLVAHENCNQFYTCNFGRPIAQICPGTLLFDPTKDRCEWRETVQCGNRVIPNPEDNDNGGGEWDPNTGGNNNDPSQAPAICAREGSDHVMIAHENCNQFYQCWAGRPVALKCPEGLFFNPKNDWCDFPSNVDCSRRLVK